jgi:catechol 2,3-dioxygenase-like lactoylglutathione lyase family enzyme
MTLQISALTLAVKDINRAKKFYADGLGCPIVQDQGQFVSFNLGDMSTTLALYTWDALAQDAGVAPEGSGFRGFTLSFIVDTAETVDATLAQAERAGGKVLKPGQAAHWGGYFGYFADPDGYLWKVAASAT